MRSAGAGLVSLMAAGTPCTVRHLLTLTLSGGTVLRWTDHTTDLVVSAQTFSSGGEGTTHPIVKVGAREDVSGLEIGRVEVTLLCGEAALLSGVRLPAAVEQGALSGATAKVERLYMPSPGDVSLGAMWLGEGPVGGVRASSSSVMLDVESVTGFLAAQWPRLVIQAGCSNMLFDTQCALVKATYTVTGTVSSGATTTVVPTSRTEPNDGYFALGVITFTSGANNGETRAVRVYAATGGTITVDRPLPVAPSNGDTFSVYPGCDKRKTTCESKFAATNIARFRGFPFVPRTEVAS